MVLAELLNARNNVVMETLGTPGQVVLRGADILVVKGVEEELEDDEAADC